MRFLKFLGHERTDGYHPLPPRRKKPSSQTSPVKTVSCRNVRHAGKKRHDTRQHLSHAAMRVHESYFLTADQRDDPGNREEYLRTQDAFSANRKLTNPEAALYKYVLAFAPRGEYQDLMPSLTQFASCFKYISCYATYI